MFLSRSLSSFLIKASIKNSSTSSGAIRKACPAVCLLPKRVFSSSENENSDGGNSEDDESKKSKLSLSTSSKFKPFDDKESVVILDADEKSFPHMQDEATEESFLYQQRKPQSFDFKHLQLKRGITGVFDIEELVGVLRQEKLRDIAVISVPKELRYCDFLVVCTAMSNRHLKAVCEFLKKLHKLKKDKKDPHMEIEGEDSTDWKAIDMDAIVLHLMLAPTREKYDIETLWTCGADHDEKSLKTTDDPVVTLMEKHMKFLDSIQPASG